MTGGTRRVGACALATVLVLAIGGGCSEERDEPGAVDGVDGPADPDHCPPDVAVVTCDWPDTSVADLLGEEPVAADPDAEPVRLGVINQDTGQLGAFPELTQAQSAAVAFVNEELGGIDGRPIEIEVCDTGGSAPASLACGQRFAGDDDVVAVLGGIDIFGDGIEVLTDNGIPYVGGIPVSFASVESPTSFQFSGGSWGAALAFADHAMRELRAESVAIVFGDFGSIRDAAEYAQRSLEAGDVAVRMIPAPIVNADFLPLLETASDGDPDAIIVLTADTGCVPAMQAGEDLGYEGALYLTGACAAPRIIAEAGSAAEGRYFNVEGPVGGGSPDTALYQAVLARYTPDLDFAGAGTVTFRAFMTLYAQLRALGGDGVDRAAIVDAFAGAVDEPNFMGHPYTCDGNQLVGLPAMCAPQQILARRVDDAFEQVGDWIQVGEVAVPA